MSKLTRWNLRDVAETEDESPLYDGMETAKNGEWVQYDDVKSIRDELARVEKDASSYRDIMEQQATQLNEYVKNNDQLQADLAACREALAHILREAPDAFGKIKREYKAVQPDALPDECWAEVESLEVAIEEAEDALKEGTSRRSPETTR